LRFAKSRFSGVPSCFSVVHTVRQAHRPEQSRRKGPPYKIAPSLAEELECSGTLQSSIDKNKMEV
jgi:hypothetical protein